MVASVVEQAPESIALVSESGATLAYRELLECVDRAVRSLRSFGIGPLQRVAIVLPNGPTMASAFIATACAGPCAPLNPAYRESEFDYYLGSLDASAVILPHGASSPARAAAVARGIAVVELVPTGDSGLFELRGQRRGEAVAHDSELSSSVALLLHTSGTTSRPKLVPLSHANLARSANHVRESLRLTAQDRCLNVMPLFHIHGIVGVLLSSISAGASVICTQSFDGPAFYRHLSHLEPTWYSAVPTIHQAVLAHAERHSDAPGQHRLRLIRSSSASLPPRVMAALGSTFHVPIIEAYGMTEASHQIASNPLPPGAQKPGAVGLPAGPELLIVDDRGGPVSRGTRGEVVIRGPNVMAGYEGISADGAFVDGYFRTGDEGYLDEDGYLFLTGRLKEIINAGGEKVAPREVDETLLEHASVAMAVAFAFPHPTLGEGVAAAVVLKPGAAATELELRRFVASRLAAFKVPLRVVFLDEIPKGPTGKLQRIGLHETLAAGFRSAFVAPREGPEAALAEVWREVLGLERVGLLDNFFLVGGDSLAANRVVEIARRRGLNFTVEQLYELPTIEALTAQVVARESRRTEG